MGYASGLASQAARRSIPPGAADTTVRGPPWVGGNCLRLDCRRRARGSLVGRGDAGCSLQRGAELEETAAEGDRANGEPCPPERESRDDVREPVDSEHHSAACHRHGDRCGRPGDEGTCARCSPPHQYERHRRIEGGRRRRMAARERRAERRCGRVEARPHPVERLLDGRDEDDLAHDDGDEKHRDPFVRECARPRRSRRR